MFLTSYTKGTIHVIVFDVKYNEDKPRTIHVIVSDVIDNEDVIELLQSAKQVNLEPKF